MAPERKFDYTDADLAAAEQNGIDRKRFINRLAQGMSVERAINQPKGKSTRHDRALIAEAERNGISKRMFYQRKASGWSDEDACRVPARRKRAVLPVDKPMTEEEIIVCLGRIKYMQQQKMEYPPPFPKPMLKKMEIAGVTLDDIEPVEVEMDGKTHKSI